MTMHIATAVRNAMLTAIATAVDAGSGPGYIEIRSGTQPANANTSATGSVLVTVTLADPSFETAASGAIDFDANPDLVATATGTGTASWARVYDSTGAAVYDGAVGTSGAEFNITSTSITTGQTITLTVGTLTLAA